MDQRERNIDHEEVLNTLLDARLVTTWVCQPAEVVSYDPTRLTCVCQPTVKINLRSADNTFSWVALPLLVDVPVALPMGGGFLITFPIEAGDEVLVVFADRCIDGWWDKGGVQIPPELRFHDLSDGFAIPGIKARPNVPGGISATDLQIIGPGGFLLDVTAAGQLTITAPAGIIINGNVEVNGSIAPVGLGPLSVTGALTASGEGTFNGIPVSTHKHTGVTTGAGDTGGPIP